MLVIFVHGWSVTDTSTYGDLPKWLAQQADAQGLDLQVGHIYLGRYVSFVDTVTLDDVARAFDQALADTLPNGGKGQRFACITHSTGGPVVREWMDLYYRERLGCCPLSHLVMLAPANHGSALAQLGKERLSRIKSFFQGVQPGTRILDWLELGSDQSWELNESWLGYDCVSAGVFPFVLTGQKIDRQFYDALNSYTGEPGSDGVVRVAGANMNYTLLHLVQDGESLHVQRQQRSAKMALGVLPGRSHCGEKIGIMRSVTLENAATHPTTHWVLRCLGVRNASDYAQLSSELDQVTAKTQADEREEVVRHLIGKRTYITNRHTMAVFRFTDDRGNALTDYDLYLTAGPDYDDNELPEGFFVDRQRNQRNPGKLTYYLDYDVMDTGLKTASLGGHLGFRVKARPEAGPEALAFYRQLDFRATVAQVEQFLRPNETLMVHIVMQRCVDKTACRMTPDLTPGPISKTPVGELVK